MTKNKTGNSDYSIGSITFNPSVFNSLDGIEKAIKELRESEQAGWNAFFRADYELAKLKEKLNGKKVLQQNRGRNRKDNKKVCEG